ncbi:MAG: peptide/nickel transport system substrate-binding protein [Alphaproteobacteria bacterium]
MCYIGKYCRGIVVFIFLLATSWAVEANEVNIAVARAPVTLDPRQATDATSVRLLRMIAPGLIKLDSEFQPTSLFLSRFGHQKYQRFYMELKAGLTYSDCSAADVYQLKAYFDSILDEKTKSPLKGAFKDVATITIEDSKRLVFTLAKPNPFFWGVLETSVVKLTKNVAQKPIGLGLYKVSSLDDFGNVDLQRLDGKQTLKFKVIKDPVVRYLKLVRGGIDIIHNDIGEEILQYGKKEGFLVHEAPSTSYSYMGFLMSEGKTADVKVRKALSYALNRGRIVRDLLGGRARPAYSLLGAGHPAHFKASIGTYSPTKAGDLLDEAGYSKDENGKRFTLRLAITSNPFIQRLAQVIQQDFVKIGVDVDISSSEWGTFYGNIKKGNFESYILTWVGRFQSDIYRSLFHSDMMPPNGANRGRYSNPVMDDILVQLMQETDDEKRHKMALQVQKLQQKDMIYIPLWKRSHVALTSQNVVDYEIMADGGYEGLLNTVVQKP